MGGVKRFLHSMCEMVWDGKAPMLTRNDIENGSLQGKEIVYISKRKGYNDLICGDWGVTVIGKLLHRSEFPEFFKERFKDRPYERLKKALWRVEYILLDKDGDPLDLYIPRESSIVVGYPHAVHSLESHSLVYFTEYKNFES